ncbi:MAG TPA: hypothetical protein ENK48_01740 [Gammaproteobacteria bacterium]|nr:hypothetical protein [Gammaproteobacteria bacterium]
MRWQKKKSKLKIVNLLKGALPGLLVLVTGCASIPANYLASSVADGIRNQEDVATAGAGIPSYLLMIDGLLVKNPRETGLLMAGARLYSTYASLFVSEPSRARVLSDRALEYARRAICVDAPAFCTGEARQYDRFVEMVAAVRDRDHLAELYTYATTWAAWIQIHASRWSSVAELPKVSALLEAVVELDEDYDHGQAHVYLGVINAQLPPSLGGRPEVGRAHFERAIELSHGRNLIAKVEFARTYARLMYDRTLYERLLREVIAAEPRRNGLTLSNVIAQRRARKLLAEIDDYFDDEEE